jgi:dihydrofolate reductase
LDVDTYRPRWARWRPGTLGRDRRWSKTLARASRPRRAALSTAAQCTYEHVFVVTHDQPTDWEHADTAPFTFVDGVEKAIAAAREFAGDRGVDVAAGQIGSQALKLGLIDQVVVNVVPVVFGSGRPFFATGALAEPLRLENPTTIVSGDRVTHLVYDVSRRREGART